MKKFFKILGAVIILGIFIYTIIFLFNKSKAEPIIYKTKSPIITNIVKKTVATGNVEPRKEVAIKPKVSGIIEKLYVKAGDEVKKGDLIAQIRIIPDMLSLNNAEARVKSAQISYNEQEIKFNRQKELYDKGIIPIADFQNYEIALKKAKEELNASEDNLQLIKEGVTKKSNGVTNTLVRSTITGMILDIPVKEGNSVIESNTFNDGTTIATIANMSDMIFIGKIDESEVGKLKLGMPLVLKIGAISDYKFNANLEYISPKGVKENGAIQFEIKASVVLNDSVFIRAGYSANADIVLAHHDSVMAIDESLIIFEDNQKYIELEKDSFVFEKVKIETGLSDEINIEVLSGVDVNDKIKVQD